MKQFYSTLVACLVLTTLIAQPAGWTYVQPIIVQNNVATQVTNYQLQLTINTQTPIGAGQMNSDGSDIRFGKDCGGNTLYNYWIESGINTATTVIWVKIDTLPASGSRQMYMYYGNSSATTTSAVVGTFVGPHSSTDSVASGGAGGVANSQRGFRFAPTEDILMTHVGKREPTGTTRTVTLFNFSTQAIVTQQTVGGPAAQYSYNPLANPVWLTQSTQYVLELYQGTGDGYYFGTSSQIGQHLVLYDMRYCNSCTQNTFPTNTLNGMHYGYPDMWYFTKQTIAVAPTVTLGSAATLSTTNSGPATVCMNDSVAVSVFATGGVAPYTYNWLPATGVGSPNSASTMISPTANTTYTCTIFDACGSGALDSVTITINTLPAVTASVSTDSVCVGSSFVPMGSGATSYSWSGGLTDNVAFTPSTTATYTVTGTDGNGCTNTATTSVEVLNLPAVVANATQFTVCTGDSIILNGSGALSYTWDNGVTDGVPYVPAADNMYHVTGTDIYGCQNVDSIFVDVNPLPALITTGAGFPYCSGNGSAAIAVSGASSYLWMPDSLTGNSVTVNPAVSTTYTVTGLDSATGCSADVMVTVVVNANPILTTMSDTACAGDCANLLAVASGGTPAYTYNWVPSAGLDNPNIPNPQACNTVSTCYTVMVTDANGCMDTLTACAFVNQLPVVAATGPATVCVTDGNYTLTGTPVSGTFSGPGVTGNSFSPSAAGNGTHAVFYSYTDGNGCTNMDTISIVVSPCVGIADNDSNDGIEVYPNPFSDELVLNLTATGTSYARIFNNLGQIVFEQEMNQGRNDINTADLAAGVYVLEVTSANGSATIKVVKQ